MRAERFVGPLTVARLLPVGVFVVAALLSIATIPHYGLVWDEPPYFRAAEFQNRWVKDLWKNLFRPELADTLRDETITRAWRNDPLQVPHPPLSRLLSGLTQTLTARILHPFAGYRLAPALCFALLATLLFVWVNAVFDRATGLFAAAAAALTPNLFGYAHFAVTDMPLATLWLLTSYAFVRGLATWRWSVVLGIVWGLALATKFPAVLIPIPLIVWAHLFHRRDLGNNVVAMLFLSPVVMIAVQPHLWHRPFLRVVEFLHEGVSRAYRPETSFPVFFNHALHRSEDLPWHYSLLMTAVSIPETYLLLAGAGLLLLRRRHPRQEFLVLCVTTSALILVLGALPGAVLHDVNRLMLPALPFVLGLAAGGFFFLKERLPGLLLSRPRLAGIAAVRTKAVVVLFAVCLALPVLDLLTYHPFELSYFNRLVGGIQGAYRRGWEITYFLEALTPDFVRFLNAELPPRTTVNAGAANFMLEYYQRFDVFRRDVRLVDSLPCDYYLLLNRRSFFTPEDWQVDRGLRRPEAGIELLGVPLLSLYRMR
jgi:hypothetical protein